MPSRTSPSSASAYQHALGFSVVFAAPGSALVHLRRRKYQDVLIVPRAGDAAAPQASLTITFNADGEIEELAARAKAAARAGASTVTGPVATPWNTLDLRVTDPAGVNWSSPRAIRIRIQSRRSGCSSCSIDGTRD